jgi:hypothetical protein
VRWNLYRLTGKLHETFTTVVVNSPSQKEFDEIYEALKLEANE